MPDLKNQAKARASVKPHASAQKASKGSQSFQFNEDDTFRKDANRGFDPMTETGRPRDPLPPLEFGYLKAFSRIPSLRRGGMNQGF